MPKPSLDNLKVAAPCPADWDGMIGNDRVRYCGQCNLNVYNISAMSRKEAENLIAQTEGRLCVRYYQRKDGTILTDNCPVGLRAIRKQVKRRVTAVLSAVFSFVAGIGVYALSHGTSQQGSLVQGQRVQGDIAGPITVTETKPDMRYATVGVMVPRELMGKYQVQIDPPKPETTHRHRK